MTDVFVSRRTRLRACRAAHGTAAGAVLVTRPANIRYLTGVAPASAALLLAADGRDVLLAPPQAAPPSPGGDLQYELLAGAEADTAVAAATLAARSGSDDLALEEHHLTVARHRELAGAVPGLRLTDLGCAVEQLRLVKDEEEIAALRIAAEITDHALGELLESILVGRTERHLALELDRRLIDHGAEGPALPTSVATGGHAGVPGHRPTDRRVEEGDFLCVRLGARYRGYSCQIGRTFVIGAAPDDWQIELYDTVFAAQRAGREALQPGTAYREVDRAARHVLESAGYTEGVGPCTGHGVGLEIREDPRITPGAMGKLDACVPVTVEPGVHLPGRGGVRIDDTLVVRPQADGGPELLTITTKELLAL
jgi:Xaa-Pro aminopeptidase